MSTHSTSFCSLWNKYITTLAPRQILRYSAMWTCQNDIDWFALKPPIAVIEEAVTLSPIPSPNSTYAVKLFPHTIPRPDEELAYAVVIIAPPPLPPAVNTNSLSRELDLAALKVLFSSDTRLSPGSPLSPGLPCGPLKLARTPPHVTVVPERDATALKSPFGNMMWSPTSGLTAVGVIVERFTLVEDEAEV